MKIGVVIFSLMGATLAHADYIDHFANTADIGTLKVPRAGTTHVLVVPVVVENLPFDQGSEEAFLDELHAFYAEEATDFGFTSYYSTLSLGRFHPIVTVADPVHFAACPPLGGHADCAIPRGAGFAEGDFQGAIATLDDSFTFIDEILRCATGGPSGDCSAGSTLR